MTSTTAHPGHPVTLNIPNLETERLRLRLPASEDFEADVEFFASDRSSGVGGQRPRHEVWRNLAALIGHWVLRGYGFWSVDEKATGQYCGRVGLWCPEDWPEPEVGWTLMAHAEGRGIAHEAALASRRHAYDVLGWKTAISLIDQENTRSKRLAARLGATFERLYDHPRFGPIEVWRHPSPEALQ